MSSKNNLVEYVLKEPIVIGEMVIEKLHFRQPKMKHFRAFDNGKSDNETFALMIEKLCELPRDVVDELSMEDFEGMAIILKNLFDKSQKK